MKSDNTVHQTTSDNQSSANDINYLSVPSLNTKQIINFKAQSQYQAANLVEDDDVGEYEL